MVKQLQRGVVEVKWLVYPRVISGNAGDRPGFESPPKSFFFFLMENKKKEKFPVGYRVLRTLPAVKFWACLDATETLSFNRKIWVLVQPWVHIIPLSQSSTAYSRWPVVSLVRLAGLAQCGVNQQWWMYCTLGGRNISGWASGRR